MNTLTGIGSKTKEGVKSRPFYHLPPTAVAIQGGDLIKAVQSLGDPQSAIEQFLSGLGRYTGNHSCYLTDSGRSALYLILLTIKKRSNRNKVILPAYTCPTVAQAVLKAGLHPIYCDVSEETFCMNRDCLKTLIDEQTLAIIPTYLYGLPHDITDLIAIGHALGIVVIEDASQAFGATFNGKPVGTIGDFGLFSMGRGKCIPTGHGGVILASHPFAADLEKTVSEHMPGSSKPDLISIAGYLAYGLATTPFGWWFVTRSPMNPADAGMDPKKLPPIKTDPFSATQAAIGSSILGRIDRVNAQRLRNALVLTEITCQHRLVSRPVIQPESQPVFLRFPVIVKDRDYADALFRLLYSAGIGVSRSYTRTLPELFSGRSSSSQARFPGATHLADCLLTLPTHRLSEADIMRIESAFCAFETP